ncbi:MAG: adenylyl-sulfate reductase subunit beta [Magnetococcales bacterium]|nr:adenylyl-sulfate reductase subunit beta [Magnetococcales bacterium]
MPSFVIQEKCDGCKEQDRVSCVYICPNNLMALDKDSKKAVNQEVDQCWECYSCVKICPQHAVEVRAYADIVPMDGSVVPLRGSDSIVWTIKFRNGNVKKFKFPIRTTVEGSINPYAGKPEADISKLDSPGFFNMDSAYMPRISD